MPMPSLLATYIATSARCSSVSAVVAVLGKAGDAEAGAHAERAVIDHARLLDLVQHLLRGQQRAVDVGAGQHDRELVAAEPRDGIGFAQHAAEARSPTHCRIAVAGVMPERVVDLLEAVRGPASAARSVGVVAVRDAQRLRQPIVQQQPVRQIGQRIVIGQVRDPLLDAPPLAARRRPRRARARPPAPAARSDS